MTSLFRGFLVISALWISSCQTGGVYIEDAPAGAAEIKRVLGVLFGPVRSTGRGGTEFVYGFHDREMKLIENPGEVRERMFPVITIVGDRRPYSIRIQAYVERKAPAGFENVGQSDAIANSWGRRIREALYEGRDRRNVIDDFKAF